MGIVRMDRSKLDGASNIFSAISSGPQMSFVENQLRVEYCVADFEGYEDVLSYPIKLDLPTVSISTCFRSSSDLTMIDRSEYLKIVNGTVTNCKLNYCGKRYKNISI